MKMFWLKKSSGWLITACLAGNLYARVPRFFEPKIPDWEKKRIADSGYITYYLDNDLFAGKDQNYTNGARIAWISKNFEAKELGEFGRAMRVFSGDETSWNFLQQLTNFRDPKMVRYNYGVSLTQLMFTPKDRLSFTQPEGERRYAGWLGLGLSLHAKDENVLNSFEWIVGTTGSNSLAENTQDLVHSLRNIPKFNGWRESQIPNSITFDTIFTQKRRANFASYYDGMLQMDGISEWGVRLGSFRTDAHVGALFRLGYNLPPDFSDPRISATAYSHRYFAGGRDYRGNWSVYGMFGSTVSVVAYDASLDGPLLTNFDTGNQRSILVGEIFAGMGIRYREWELSYVQTLRTKEYREQDDRTVFGSLALRLRF